MPNDSYAVKLTGTGTTTLGSVNLYNICINKTLAGTMTIQEGATALGAFAIGAVAGNYHQNPNGSAWTNLQIVLSAGDDVTVYVKRR